MVWEKLHTIVERNAGNIVDWARQLVQIESENHPPHGNEQAVQQLIVDYWKQCGIDYKIFSPAELPNLKSHPAYCEMNRDYSARPVVIASLKGSGGGKSLILSGHVDTVPAGSGDWEYPPYAAEIVSGRLYGRGAFDMKGGVAAMMMAARLLQESGVQLKGDLIVETVPDEEFAGANGTAAARAYGCSADAAIVGEPTGLRVVAAHSGFRLARVTIRGRSGISVIDEELENPVEHLVPVLKAIERFRKDRAQAVGRDSVMITKLAANEFKDDELLTTPADCRIEVYWQLQPDERIEDIDQDFEAAILGACDDDAYLMKNPPHVDYHLRAMPGSAVAPNSAIITKLCATVDSVTGAAPAVLTSFPPCDLFVFNKHCGIPAVAFGPGGGGAHAPNEYVLVDDIIRCTEIYAAFATEWCGCTRNH